MPAKALTGVGSKMKKSSLKILLEFFGTVFLFAIIFTLIDLSEAREGVKLTKGFFLRFGYSDYLVFSVIAGLLYTGRQVYKRVKSREEKRSITDIVLESLAIAWLIAIFLPDATKVSKQRILCSDIPASIRPSSSLLYRWGGCWAGVWYNGIV